MNDKQDKSQGGHFHDQILLHIHRNYSLDESIKYLEKELQKYAKEVEQLNIKNGQLKSGKSELMDENKKLSFENLTKQKEIDNLKKDLEGFLKNKSLPKYWTKELLRDSFIANLKRQLDIAHEKSRTLQAFVDTWRNKYLSLVAKNSKNP